MAALYGAAGEEVRSLVECHRGSNGDRAPASLPIAGLFCGGEIGPCAAGGAAGLQIGGVGERQDDGAPIGEEGIHDMSPSRPIPCVSWACRRSRQATGSGITDTNHIFFHI